MDYLAIANSLPMWLAAGLAISVVVFQGVLFAVKSYNTGKAIGLTEVQMKDAMKSSMITSIGPSIVILTGLLALLVTVGGPMAWMRLSLIGSVMFEMMAAGFGAAAVGVQMGTDPMTNVAFANAVWTMILGSIGWVIFATLTADKMGKVQEKAAKGDKGTLLIISTSAMLGAFGALVSPHLMAMNNNTVAALAGAAIMLVVNPLAKKKDIKWLKEWGLAIAQSVAKVDPGTEEGSIIATLGMAVSVIVNIVILAVGVLAGTTLLANLPPEALQALNYLLPALFGALFIQFTLAKPKLAPIAITIALFCTFMVRRGIFPFYLPTLVSVFGTMFIGIALYKKKLI